MITLNTQTASAPLSSGETANLANYTTSFDSAAGAVPATSPRPGGPKAGKEASVTIAYRAEPTQGLYFRTPEMGYKAGDTHLYTQGEPTEARHWYPCFDAPNEKFTSEIVCRVPEGMTVLSNGRRVSEEKDGGLVAVRWLQDKPHVNYLISLVAGYFKSVEDKYHRGPAGILHAAFGNQ